MALVVRYFSTTAAGDGDGTSWANRAALFDGSNNWSSVITGFDFSGSDGLECRIGPGTYSSAQSLESGLFSNAPTIANPLILHGCDNDGDLLSPNDPDWVSSAGPLDTTGFPVISLGATTTWGLAHCTARLLRVTKEANASMVTNFQRIDWCSFELSSTGTSGTVGSVFYVSNSQFVVTGSSYSAVCTLVTHGACSNLRAAGDAGASGNRDGLRISNQFQAFVLSGVTVLGVGGVGISIAQAAYARLRRVLVVDTGGDGINVASTTTNAAFSITGAMVTGCGGYGLSVGTTPVVISGSRFRDNTSGNINGIGNYPDYLDIEETDSDDATEYVDAANGDYRIKYGSAIWGKGYGVADEPAPSGGGSGGRQPRLVTIS